MKLPFQQAVKLLEIAEEHERKEYYYQQWLMVFAKMEKETFVSFADYYESTKPTLVDNRSKDEIMKEIIGGIYATF